MLYKVVKEEGVTVDDVEFAKDQILDLEPDALNVSDLLADGSIVETTEEEELAVPEPVLDGEAEPSEPVIADRFFDGKKIVGEITEVEDNGIIYKCFSVEDGATFKVPEEEFKAKEV